MDSTRERGRRRAEEGLSEEEREQGEGEQGKEENVKGGIPRKAPTGQCTVYSQTIPQRGPWPSDFGITNEK